MPVRRPAVGLRRPPRSARASAGAAQAQSPKAPSTCTQAPFARASGISSANGSNAPLQTLPACRQTTAGPSSPPSTAAQRLRPHPPLGVRRRDVHPLGPEPEQPQRQIDRGMRLAAEHHVDLGRAEQAPRLDVPAGPAQQLVPRRGQRGEVRHRRPGGEADARLARQPEQRRAASPAATSSQAAAAGVGSAKPPVCPQAEVSQSAATPAGCEAPITQPWKVGAVMPISPPSARRTSSATTAVRRPPRLRQRPAEGRERLGVAALRPHLRRRHAAPVGGRGRRRRREAPPRPSSSRPAQTPEVRLARSRTTCRGAVSSFHFESAACTGGNGARSMNFPRPGAGSAFAPGRPDHLAARQRVARRRADLHPLEDVVVDRATSGAPR